MMFILIVNLLKANLNNQVLKEIIEEERPPMNTVAEYREKFGLS